DIAVVENFSKFGGRFVAHLSFQIDLAAKIREPRIRDASEFETHCRLQIVDSLRGIATTRVEQGTYERHQNRIRGGVFWESFLKFVGNGLSLRRIAAICERYRRIR